MALTRDQIDDLAEEGVFLGNVYEIAQAIEAEVRGQDEALIRQLVDALEHIHRCIPMGGFAQIHWGSATFEQLVEAAEAGRTRLDGKP